jgi:hypothetical protein
VSAARASMASGLCLLAGWLLGNLGAGLTANLGAFAALYGRGRPTATAQDCWGSLFAALY